jgi:hypothetical protein
MSLQLFPGALVTFRPDSVLYRDLGRRFAIVRGAAILVITAEPAVAGPGPTEPVTSCERWVIVRTLPCRDCPEGEMLLVHPSSLEPSFAPEWN